MIKGLKPLLPPTEIWNNNTVLIPKVIAKDYRTELERIGRYDDACKKDTPENIIGGIDQASTNDHFAFRFGASLVRTEYLLLDPHAKFTPLSDELLLLLSDGVVSVLDIPCGSGAGILGLLGVIAAFRTSSSVPRLPLEVRVTAGDLSPYARTLYDNMMSQAMSWLEPEGVRLVWTSLEWDASDEATTARVVDTWIDDTRDCDEHLVLISAFSGAAATRFKHFDRSFQHIAARQYDRLTTILWVEPAWNKTRTFLGLVAKLFQGVFGALFTPTDYPETSFRWEHPFNGSRNNGKLTVLQHKRPGL